MAQKVIVLGIMLTFMHCLFADDKTHRQLVYQQKEIQKVELTQSGGNKSINLAQPSQTAAIIPQNKLKPCPGICADSFITPVTVHVPCQYESDRLFLPIALMAGNRVITYIGGTPVITSPYTGARPSFDGSDYIVNISSINRDIRLMEQRRNFYLAYRKSCFPVPNTPIIALSGKAEPVADISKTYSGSRTVDLNLGSSELDLDAILNEWVEAFIGISYDETPPPAGPRIDNSVFFLNQGFINIGNLAVTPFYFTAGQLFVPFGRFSSSMISAPLTRRLARVQARPVILGYKSQNEPGFFAALYGFRSDTTDGSSGVGGINLGYKIKTCNVSGELGVSFISSIADAGGMQNTGSLPETTFGGFGSITNGSEAIRGEPAVGAHATIRFDRYNLTAEWVGVTHAFNSQTLSFNGHGAKPQAGQLEAGVTFMLYAKPASLSLGYQWSKQTLALNIPEHRFSGVFNISIWKDTVESLEYRHELDFKTSQFANGASPMGVANQNTVGTSKSADSLIAQIGVYF